MERQCLDLGEPAFLLINGPLVLLGFIANTFYAYCLIFPPCNRHKLKQPLKTLLGFLVWCSITYFAWLPVMYGVLKVLNKIEIYAVSWFIVVCYTRSSMTCSVWLNFYYYIQIVPSQRALLIWVKRNIRSFIYVSFLLEEMLILFSAATKIANVLFQTSRGFIDINGTQTEHYIDGLHLTSQVSLHIIKLHMFCSLCIAIVSSFSTVRYLHRHIRSMTRGGFSTLRIQSQMRVAATGVSQGVLYFLYGAFYLFDLFTYNFSTHFYLSMWVFLTTTSLYISGTTVNLGIGQTLFRQSVANVWKALKALCGIGMVSNDVKMYTIQSTSGIIANTVTDAQM